MRKIVVVIVVSVSVLCTLGCKTGSSSQPGPPSASTYTLSVVVSGSGAVTPNGGTFNGGELVTLTAAPGAGYVVASWDGAVNDNSADVVNRVKMDRDRTVYVFFLEGDHSDHIAHIDSFLDICPQDDPAYELIRHDFNLLVNGVDAGPIDCSEPVSQLHWGAYSDQLIVVQALRVVYHMDYGQEGHLPWTPGTLYHWLREKLGGIDIRTDIQYTHCCDQIDGENYISFLSLRNVTDREFFQSWRGIASVIALLAHEARHVDGYSHPSCCGINGGCDEDFDLNDLSPYGIQWYLNKLWLEGGINVGVQCLTQDRIDVISDWQLRQCNSTFSRRFCYTHPPLIAEPVQPGGPCLN